MKKINILAAIMALGLVLGFASCDLDKDSTSAELDDDAVALVANQIYLTPDSSKGIKVTLLYNENNTSFWSDYRYTKFTVYKVVTGGSNVQQLTFSVQEDGQVPTADEPEKIIYYPFTEAGETYRFGFNGASKDIEATSGIGEVLNVPSNPTLSYTTNGYQRLFRASGCTVKGINDIMDDVTDTYDINFQFNVYYYNNSVAKTRVTGMEDETGTGAGDFFTDLFSANGADILSTKSGYLWNDRDYIDNLLMSGSNSYKQNKFYIQGEFVAKVVLDETKYGSCTYFVFDINSPDGQTYYSKNSSVNGSYVVYYDTWTTPSSTSITRNWIFNSNGAFSSCTGVDETTNITYFFDASGNLLSYSVVDTSYTPARTYYYDASGNVKYYAVTESDSTYYYDTTGNAVWIVKENGSYYFNQSGNVWTSNNQNKDSTTATTTWTINLKKSASVSIPYTVSSESSWDKLTITLDGVTKVNAISGTKTGTISVTLAAGVHTVVAKYTKDTSYSYNSDCGTITLNPVNQD